MSESPDTVSDEPATICGYTVDCALAEDRCYLAIGPGGRGVVVKRMDDECVLNHQLHPAVRERLARVREIAHGGVANLFGVERDAGAAWLVWEYVPGLPFDAFAANPDRSLRDLAAAGREVALAVDLLHMQGVVHGSIHGGNVIVAPGGAVRLTHVSPLLYTDPVPDADAVLAMLEAAVSLRGGENSSLGWLLARAREERPGLRGLAARLAALVASGELEGAGGPADDAADRRPRRRALYGAVAAALVGAVGGVVAWRMAVSPELRASVKDRVQGWVTPAEGTMTGEPASGPGDLP